MAYFKALIKIQCSKETLENKSLDLQMYMYHVVKSVFTVSDSPYLLQCTTLFCLMRLLRFQKSLLKNGIGPFNDIVMFHVFVLIVPLFMEASSFLV